MTATQIPVLLHLFFGIMAMYVSRFHLKKSEKFTADGLRKANPKYKWIQKYFMLLYNGWVVLLFAVFFSIASSWVFEPYAVGAFFACIGLFLGVFALKTGVCFVPKKGLETLFVVGDDAYRAGILQTIWSITVIVLAFVLTGRV